MKLEIELGIPDGAVDKCAEAELIRSAKEQTALNLYSDDRVTIGEVAGMLGLTRIQFLDLLQRSSAGSRGIPERASVDRQRARLRVL